MFENSIIKQFTAVIVKHEHNRRYKLILEIGLSKGFAPTRLIISIFHRLIGQYFESGILFISLANLHGGKRWLDVWERRRQAPLYSNQSPRWVYNAYHDRAYLYSGFSYWASQFKLFIQFIFNILTADVRIRRLAKMCKFFEPCHFPARFNQVRWDFFEYFSRLFNSLFFIGFYVIKFSIR